MKRGLVVLLLASSVFAHGQSLKDALFSGKLKNEPGAVIRKSDDLSSKIDTTRKVAMADAGKTTAVPATDTSMNSSTQQPDAGNSTTDKSGNDALATDTTAVASTGIAPAAKGNNARWKVYTDSVISTLKTDVLPSKKIKRGDYFVLVSYTIDATGAVTIGNVSVSPDNTFLQQQVQEKLEVDTPRLDPVLSSGVPHKVTKKYSFTLTK